MNFDIIFFSFISLLAVGSAIVMVSQRNPVKSVLFLIVNFFCLAVLYLLLQAQFIAIIQILVYAGAIMVLFLFVIMLLNLRTEDQSKENSKIKKYAAVLLSCIILFQIIAGIGLPLGGNGSAQPPSSAANGTVESIGMALFTTYLLPFEITSMLLLAAMVSVIVLAKRHFD